MKRYKVVGHSFSARNGVPSGLEDFMQKLEDANAEICLEEVEDEISSHTARGSKHNHASSSAFGTEEVKEEKEVTRGFAGCSHGSGRVCRHCYKGGKLKIHTDYTNFHITEDQPKEEKEHRHCWEKMEQLNADHGDCEFCCECKRPYQPCGVKRATDQPLTPKDVGMMEEESYRPFHDWIENNYDRLYQEFLKEQLNNKE